MITLKETKTTIYAFINSGLRNFSMQLLFIFIAFSPIPGLCDPPEFSLSPDTHPVISGDDFIVELRSNDQIQDMRQWTCTFAFDPSVLAIRKITAGDVVEPTPFFLYSAKSDKSIKILSINMEPSDIPNYGLLASLHCGAINPGIEVLDAIACSYEDADGNEFSVDVAVEPLNITGERIYYGDLDQEGDIDGRDIALLSKQISGWDCGEDDDCTGDFDNSGRVNWQDVAIFAASFGAVDLD
jgi:hypothetical protein